MSMSLRADPELTAVIERARERAEASGELQAKLWSMLASLPVAAREIVASWVSDGGYARAVAAAIAEDGDLAYQ